MARRKLSADEERQLISDAEAARDDPSSTPTPVQASKGDSKASAVLSVRVPAEDVRKLRAMAEREGISMSQLLQDAVEQLISAPETYYYASESVKRLVLSSSTGPVRIGSSSSYSSVTYKEVASSR